jgi:hydroxymethylpyrimidine pyrophosphatase-like HAD family hydrolase
MSNIINSTLKKSIQSGKIGIIADVDGSLTPPGNHPELLNYNDTIIEAYDATSGAFMFLTNNDGRSISQVTKKIKRNMFNALGHADASFHFKNNAAECEFKFPIVSECATRIRHWLNGKEIVENADNTPQLEAIEISNYLKIYYPELDALIRKLDDGRNFYQEKENTVCFNFEEGNLHQRQYLVELCGDILSMMNISGVEIVSLIDSVEIIPTGAHKKNVLNFLNKFPEFNQKDFILMIGDTETDADVAKELYANGQGAMIAVGDNVVDGPHVIQRVSNIRELMTLLHHVSLEINANKKMAFYADTNQTISDRIKSPALGG